jgi:hypothetical protein
MINTAPGHTHPRERMGRTRRNFADNFFGKRYAVKHFTKILSLPIKMDSNNFWSKGYQSEGVYEQ